MKAPVGRIVILCLTGGAHCEGCHRGLFSIIRQAHDDGMARAAIGAVGKGIAKSPITDIHHFSETIRTSGCIRHDVRFNAPALTCNNGKGLERRGGRKRCAFKAFDARQRWSLTLERIAKGIQLRFMPPDTNRYSRSIIQYFAGKAKHGGAFPDHGPKPDPLYQSSDPDAQAGLLLLLRGLANAIKVICHGECLMKALIREKRLWKGKKRREEKRGRKAETFHTLCSMPKTSLITPYLFLHHSPHSLPVFRGHSAEAYRAGQREKAPIPWPPWICSSGF